MKQYKIDTHVHTSETSRCGRVTGSELVRLYIDAGYHEIVITDHFYRDYFEKLQERNWEDKVERYLSGYREACKEGRNLGLKVILGMEIRFEENFNDYLVYGFDETFLMQNRELYKLGLEEFRKIADDNELMVFQAHPFREGVAVMPPAFLDGIEVFNGNPRHNSRNDTAYLYADENHLKKISGSDFHHIGDLARGGIIVPEIVNTPREFAQLLREERIVELIGKW